MHAEIATESAPVAPEFNTWERNLIRRIKRFPLGGSIEALSAELRRHMFGETVTTATAIVTKMRDAYGTLWADVGMRRYIENCLVDAGAEALDFVRRAVSAYPETYIRDRWARNGSGVVFTTNGMVRLATIFGWIDGLAETNPAFAGALALDILAQFDRLSTYGGPREDDATVNRFVVVVTDDGTRHGFGLAWYNRILPGSPNADERYAYREWPHGTVKFEAVYAFNGGLIYHGPRPGDVMDARLMDRNIWSVHT